MNQAWLNDLKMQKNTERLRAEIAKDLRDARERARKILEPIQQTSATFRTIRVSDMYLEDK